MQKELFEARKTFLRYKNLNFYPSPIFVNRKVKGGINFILVDVLKSIKTVEERQESIKNSESEKKRQRNKKERWVKMKDLGGGGGKRGGKR